MARRLQALIQLLDLDPGSFRVREGQAVGDCPRSDTDAVDWRIVGMNHRVGADGRGAGWDGYHGDRFTAAAELQITGAGVYRTDTDYDTGANGARTARTPLLAAAGVRAWLGLEVLVNEDADDSTAVLVRLYDGDTGDELYWSGAEWTAGVTGSDDPATWNTVQVAQDNFASLPGNVRSLGVLAWLRTTDADHTPTFYGVRVAYGVRQVAPLDDALIRTLLGTLRTELRATGVLEWTTTALTATVELGEDASGPGSFAYDVTDVAAVFNLTDDPDELTELPGTFAGGTWTPTTPIPAGKVVRLEFDYRPDLVVRRHQDLENLARLPAVYIGAGELVNRQAPQGWMTVRDTKADPPTALELPEPERVTMALALRVVGELGSDVQRISQALTSFLATRPDGSSAGLGLARVLVSPETGQVVHVRAVSRPVESPAALAQGVAEARAGWLLIFPRATAQTTTAATLISADGFQPTAALSP